MKYVNNIYINLLLVFVLLSLSKETFATANTYEMEIGGVYQDLSTSTTVSVCPNTTYNIRIKAAVSGQVGHFVSNASNTASAIEYSTDGGVTYSAGPLCTNGASQQIIIARFLTSGIQGIDVYDYTQNASAPVGSCTSPAAGELGTISTFSFDVQEPVTPVLDASIDACVNSGDLLITAGCSATGALCTGSTVTYEWFQGASSLAGPATAANSGDEFTVTAATISGLTAGTGNFTLTLAIYKDHTGRVCVDQADIVVNRRELPALANLAFDKTNVGTNNSSDAYTSNSTDPSTESEICLNETQEVTVSCSGGCPPASSVNGSNYEWFIRGSTETTITPIGANIRTSGAVDGAAGSTNASGTGEYTIDPNALSINPGIHDVLVVATNEWGCTAQLELADDFIVNDLPGVELQHDGSLGGALTSLDDVIVCTGREIGFLPYTCDANDYTTSPATVYTKNLTNDSDPNNNTLGPTGTYNTACGGSNNDYFAALRWRVYDGATLLSIGGTSPNFTAEAAGATAFTSIVTTGTINSVAGSTALISTELTGTLTYELVATGYNGCENTDQVDITIQDPTITYETVPTDGTTYTHNQRIDGCENTAVSIEAFCDLCEPGFGTTWSNNTLGTAVNVLDPSPASNATSNPVSSIPLILDGTTHYRVDILDSKGCKTPSATSDRVRLRGVAAPTLSSIAYANPLCSGDDFVIGLTAAAANDLTSYNYDLYDGDPAAGGTLVYSCTVGNCSVTNLNTAANTADLTTTGYQPVDGRTYYLVAKEGAGGDCETTVGAPAAASVGITPNPSIGVSYRGVYSSTFCNNREIALYIDLNGADDDDFGYTWSVVNQNPTIASGAPDLDAGLTPFSNGNGGGGFFGFFSNPPRGATISSNHLNGAVFSDVDIQVIIEDLNSSCSQTLAYDNIDVINCEEPLMTAEMTESNGNPVTGFGNQEIGAPNKDFDVLCEGYTMILTPDIGSTTSSFTTYSASYNGNTTSYRSNEATFSWNSGESSQSISITATTSTPDTVTRSVFIIDLNGDTTAYLEHEFIVSRGNVNFYPQGDNSTSNVDTAICENDLLFAQANCPECFGDLSYEWDGTGPTIVSSGVPYQTYYDGPPAGTPTATFDVQLILRHGETGICEETIDRQISVNQLPTVGISYNGIPVTTAGGAAYLCDGEVGILSANCGTCTSSSIQWNTTATTPAINVITQGGYYALIEDQDGCKSITGVAVVIDALDGLNSVVVANPSEVCDGNPIDLEVAPCVGCTYQWVDQTTGAVIPPARIHSTVDTGIYYAVVTNAQNCVYPTASLTINSTTPAVPNIFGTTDSVCSNQSATLWTDSGVGFQYQWYKDDGSGFFLISGATDSSYTTTPGEIGSFKVAVIYTNGCSEESGVFVINSATFTPNIYDNGINEICKDATVALSTDLFANYQYQWYRDGILIANSAATGSVYNASNAGSYYVEVTNFNLCVAQSSTIDLTKTTLSKPRVTTTTPTICPDELGKLSVSLCTGCQYEWFNTTPTSLSPSSVLGFNYDSVTTTGDYYAIVSKGICFEISDTVNVTVNSVFTPAITSSSNVVCNGRDATLITQGCVGCSYSWLKDGTPALGALNDTFHLVDDIGNIGDYQIAVDYPNGCSDTSGILTISDGSYTVNLEVDTFTAGPPDSVICNGVGETLKVTPSTNLTGTYFHTLFLDNTPVTGYSSVTTNSFPGNDPGVYTVETTDPIGCKATSNLLPLRAVDIFPTLTARATSDPSSVPTSAICTPTGTAYLEIEVTPACPDCTYEWEQGGSVVASNVTIYRTNQGATGAGIYIVDVVDDGCLATSNSVNIANLAGTLDSEANTTDTSICNGQSVILEHAVSNGNPTVNCPGCSFRWLRFSNPINGASNFQFTTSTPGTYNLEVTTSTGCVDTSSNITIRQVDPPPGLVLDFDSLTMAPLTLATGTPLASNGSVIDLNNWVFPAYARYDLANTNFNSYFTSAPFNGALFANAGLEGTDSILFRPADSLAGFHLITYYYDTLGCIFTVDDVLEVLPPAEISVTNQNPASVAYEACVGDNLVINTVNLDFAIDEVFIFDTDDNYQLAPIPLANFSSTSNTFGTNVRWNTDINLTVQGDAYASYFMLVGPNLITGTRDTIFTSFVLIHNTDLSFTGLPNMLCSNGEGITLFGSPTGGTFAARTPNGTAALGSLISGAVVGDTLYPQQFNQGAFVDGNQFVDIYYSFTESYTNGNLCPAEDTVSIQMEVKDVRLTDVQFNTISVSQTRELLTNLIFETTPYAARPNKQPLYTSSFAGSFTNPAGSPTEFLPALAGIGTHALTYRIQSGDCVNSVEDSITVIPAPTPIPMPDTICRNYGTTPFAREIAVFPYDAPLPLFPPNTIVASYNDTINILNVSGLGVQSVSTVIGNESFVYDPTIVPGNYDTLIIEYGFYRDEDTLDATGNPIDFDTLEYVVARIIKPIYIEDLTPVNIVDTIVSPFYCQENTLQLLAGSPSNNSFGGGLFMLYGGTNQYQFGDTLFNSVINTYDVNNLENATTTYDLVYILNGAACNNSDTMSITIGRGLNPSFTTSNGLDEFCDTDPNVLITHNVLPPDTAIWLIGGVPQPSYVFGPDPLDPGIHVVELQQLFTYIHATDTFVCSASAVDTFTVHALPALTMTPSLDNQYCANDTIVDFVVGPSPGCPTYAVPGHVILDEKFDVGGVPPSWNSTFNISGKSWVATPLSPQGGTGNAAFIDTSQVLNDSWLITKPLDLVVGHTYRLTYMVRAGELDPTCSGLCDAQLTVGIGTTASAPMSGTLVPLIIVNNDQTYVRYTVDHYHDPALGFATGQYFIGFRSVTPAFGRSLRLDNVRMRDMTLGDCSLDGIGYVDGPGAYNVVDSAYQFDPLAVPAGNIEVKYVYTDIRGCQDSLVYPITVDTAPVVSFTPLPPTYCVNEPTLLLTGTPLGGTFTSTSGANLVPVGLAVLDTADFPVNYQTNVPVNNDIVSYRFEDDNGCSEIVHDTIIVYDLLDSMVISSGLDPFGNGHCVDADSTILDVGLFSGSPITNGAFYGSGVRNGLAGPTVATFYPDSAEIDMGHTGDVTIEYIYTTTTGCADTTRFTTRVHAVPDLTFMNLPDSLCLNADSFQVVALNNVVTGSMGQLTYIDTLINEGTYSPTDTSGVALPNFIQLFDTLYPYTAAGYNQVNVTYTYTATPAFGLCTSTIFDSVRIDTVPNVYFEDLRPYYCENEPASIFLAFPAFSVGSGYLLIDSVQVDSSFFWINPGLMINPDTTTAVYPVYYTFTDTRGCSGEAFDTFEVRPYPRITFDSTAQDTFCRQIGLYDLRNLLIAPIGGYFTDNLALTSIQDSFYLNLNSLAGPRLVTYHYLDSATQCQNQDSIWLYLFNSPEIDFTIYGGCSQMDITFDGVANNLVNGIDSITRIWWDFEGNGTITNSHLDTSAITIPDTTHFYNTNGTYNVTLNVQNQGSCPASITKPLIVSPYYDLATDYFEDFNSGAGDWYDDQPISVTPNNVWTHENSLTSNFISNSNGFWVTMAAEPYYEIDQSAWVYSPCFDFTYSRRPMIAFDLWRDVLPGIDGAVLEFYNNSSNQWELVGNLDEGINWYQSDFILGRPGNQLNALNPSGWTGRSNGSESARLRLDQFKGQRDVRFRIAFATSSQTVIDSTSGNGYEGVAFDNVWIGERTRNVLVEHFDHVDYVNTNSLTSSVINQSVYNKIFNSYNGLDVILVQYQTEEQSLPTDPLFSTNTQDLRARQLSYSAKPNNIFVDGRTIGDGLSESLNQWEMDYDMLQFPDFAIEIDTPITIVNGEASISATVEALVAKDSSIAYTTRVAVIQDSFTYVGNSHMLSVVRKLLPNNAGTRKVDGWQQGEQQFINEVFTVGSVGSQVPFNTTRLEVVVFVQNADDGQREIYQAATTQDVNTYTGTTKLEDDIATEIFNLNVYPNPSSDLFNVEFDKALEGEYNWRLVDVTGRVLQSGMTTTGTEKFTVNADRLVDGAYFFIINSDDNRAYAQRKLIVIK